MKKTVTIYGRTFEVQKDTVNKCYVSSKSLYDCYERPSTSKVAIYEDWKNWFIENGSYEFGVCSYNCNYFSIEGIVEQDGIKYYLYITYAHNRAYIIA